jgi:leucyl-tRNA synthetase
VTLPIRRSARPSSPLCNTLVQTHIRLTCQVSHSIFRMIAPITPHLSEELYEHSGRRIKRSVFLDHWEKRVS